MKKVPILKPLFSTKKKGGRSQNLSGKKGYHSQPHVRVPTHLSTKYPPPGLDLLALNIIESTKFWESMLHSDHDRIYNEIKGTAQQGVVCCKFIPWYLFWWFDKITNYFSSLFPKHPFQ